MLAEKIILLLLVLPVEASRWTHESLAEGVEDRLGSDVSRCCSSWLGRGT